MRDIVQAAARRPGTGRWQIVIVEDADRLTEQAANALLKVVEEPPSRTVFLLCAPSVDPEDISVTLRSRCRHVALVTPTTADIERVLVERDGLVVLGGLVIGMFGVAINAARAGACRRPRLDRLCRCRGARPVGR